MSPTHPTTLTGKVAVVTGASSGTLNLLSLF